MLKRGVHIVVLLGVIAIIITSLAFSSGEIARVKCDGVTVIIGKNSPRFLDEEEIAEILKKSDKELFEKKLDAINTNELEEKLLKVGSIRKAEVFKHVTGDGLDFKGHIIAEVEQRTPIMRIVTGKDDYYMDVEGVKIEQTDKFTAKVLVVTGLVGEKFAREQLLPVVEFIDADELWKAQIEQIYVEDDGELVLVPQVGDQLIEFGKPLDYQKKFRNLKALYKQVFAQSGWKHYDRISLKYQNQVVCTKK